MNIKQKVEGNGFIVLNDVVPAELIEPDKSVTNEIIEYFENDNEDPFSDFFMEHRIDQGALYDLFFRLMTKRIGLGRL